MDVSCRLSMERAVLSLWTLAFTMMATPVTSRGTFLVFSCMAHRMQGVMPLALVHAMRRSVLPTHAPLLRDMSARQGICAASIYEHSIQLCPETAWVSFEPTDAPGTQQHV